MLSERETLFHKGFSSLFNLLLALFSRNHQEYRFGFFHFLLGPFFFFLGKLSNPWNKQWFNFLVLEIIYLHFKLPKIKTWRRQIKQHIKLEK